MLKNNNQLAVKRIAVRSMRKNGMRNLFVILAIVLTTFMFTTVFSIGFSLAQNLNTMSLRQQGTKASIYLDNPTDEQITQAKSCKHLLAAGLRIKADTAQSIANEDTTIGLFYYNQTEFEENFLPAVSHVKGNYPTNEMEIMLSVKALKALQIEKPTGQMKIPLLINGSEQIFHLSGWYTDYSSAASSFQAFVSQSYIEKQGCTAEKDGQLSISAKTGKQADLLDELEEQIVLKQGQTIDTSFDVQDENGSNVLVIATVIGLIGLIIIFSGYLLIYNVMYISVNKDIRFYGMLKTVGTSPKQIQKIVRLQAFRLSVIGIPLGILLGTVVSFAAVPYALQLFGEEGIMPTNINFNPLLYLVTILFGIVTVAISCRKPAKLASRISPVEALKYNGQNAEKIKPKKGTDGGKLHKMAFRNVFREKKRATLVFASLFMGTIAFLSTNTLFSSMKLENYVNRYLPHDYIIYINSGSNDSEDQETISNNRSATSRLIDEIHQIDGITNVEVSYTTDINLVFDPDVFRPFIEMEAAEYTDNMIATYSADDSLYTAPLVAVSRKMMERYNQTAKKKIDLDRFEKGEICFVGYVNTEEQAKQIVGKTITMKEKQSGKSLSLEVGCCPTRGETEGIDIGYFWKLGGAPDCILISEAAMEKLTDTPDVNNIIVDCDQKEESYVTAQIKTQTTTNPAVAHTDIKSEQIESFRSSMMSMNVLTGGMSIVLILIGVINFINVMLTSVFTRRIELAVMESVGMTKKQVRKMLMMEGLYYGMITIGLILTVGNAIIMFVAKMAPKIADYAVFHYPFGWMIAIAVTILFICILVPAITYRMISKSTITERLRKET